MLDLKFLAASLVALGLAPARSRDEPRARRGGRSLRAAETRRMLRIARRFARFDASVDGKLQRDEFEALVAGMK